MIEQRERLRYAIAARAHELYVQRGGELGRDVEDWLKAERELARNRVLDPATIEAFEASRLT